MQPIAFLGYGRAGKDTGAMWLGIHTPYKYVGSTSDVVNPMIAKELGMAPEECFASRHKNRMYWYQWANEYRKDDPSKIAQATLDQGGTVAVGLRDIRELEACKNKNMFGLIVWVENPRVPKDPTVTFDKTDCDIVVLNDGSLPQFFSRLWRLCKFTGIPVNPVPFRLGGPAVPHSLCERRWCELNQEAAQNANVDMSTWLKQSNEEFIRHCRMNSSVAAAVCS